MVFGLFGKKRKVAKPQSVSRIARNVNYQNSQNVQSAISAYNAQNKTKLTTLLRKLQHNRKKFKCDQFAVGNYNKLPLHCKQRNDNITRIKAQGIGKYKKRL